MAAANFDVCLEFVFKEEGGYVDDPLDPGGATNLGITLNVLSEWRHTAVTKADVQNLGKDEAGAIYRAKYWNVVRGDDLPAGVDLMVFDAAVNLGAGRSARILQIAVGANPDGAIGPATLESTQGNDSTVLISKLTDARVAWYQSLSTFSRFGKGWTARVNRAKQLALQMA
ncbi:MAG: glycoside hydrolase family 108 protein [Acetobacteraceae bacterium]|nr:glycoside hydrolase family 108 protein [Acetobacteraceae bacterium]